MKLDENVILSIIEEYREASKISLLGHSLHAEERFCVYLENLNFTIDPDDPHQSILIEKSKITVPATS